MKKGIFIFVAILGLSSLSFSAFSFNSNFLSDLAGSKFTKEDWKMQHAATYKALQLPDGKKATWRNADTDHEGFIEPLNKTNKNGMMCRNLRIFNRAGHDKELYVFMFCKSRDGWKIVR